MFSFRVLFPQKSEIFPEKSSVSETCQWVSRWKLPSASKKGLADSWAEVEALASGDGDPNLYFIAEGNSIMYPRYGPI